MAHRTVFEAGISKGPADVTSIETWSGIEAEYLQLLDKTVVLWYNGVWKGGKMNYLSMKDASTRLSVSVFRMSRLVSAYGLKQYRLNNDRMYRYLLVSDVEVLERTLSTFISLRSDYDEQSTELVQPL